MTDNTTPSGAFPASGRRVSPHDKRNRWILVIIVVLAIGIPTAVTRLHNGSGLRSSRHYGAVGSTRTYTASDANFDAAFGSPTVAPSPVVVTLEAVLDRGVTEDLAFNSIYATNPDRVIALRFKATNNGTAPVSSDLGTMAVLVTSGGTISAFTELDATNAGDAFQILSSIPAGSSVVGVVAFSVPTSAHLTSVTLHPSLAVSKSTALTWSLAD